MSDKQRPAITDDLESQVFEIRETERSHQRYSYELEFFHSIKNGDVLLVKKLLPEHALQNMGIMSKSPLRQLMYGFVAGITLITRFAIEGGLSEEEAYVLSDIYIQKADRCTLASDLHSLYRIMAIDFATQVQSSKERLISSASLQKTINYIFSHLHYKISLNELAAYTGFSENYLCHLFHQQTGDTITCFIHKKRIAEAESLLRYSEYSITEISQYLGFSSQSHFTSIFHRYAGMTPTAFRKIHFRRNWGNTTSEETPIP